MISAVILAAGSSARMGQANKLMLNYQGRPLVRNVVETITSSKASEVIVVTGHEASTITAALEGLDVVFAHNASHSEGIMSSRRKGIQAATKSASGYMVCLADLPCVESYEVDQLIESFQQVRVGDCRAIVRPTHRGLPGHPIIFAGYYRPMLLSAQDGRTLVQLHGAHLTNIPWPTHHVTRDVDSPEAYRRVSAPASSIPFI